MCEGEIKPSPDVKPSFGKFVSMLQHACCEFFEKNYIEEKKT